MDGLLGEEERELRVLIAEHCLDAFPSSSSSTTNNDHSSSSNININNNKKTFVMQVPSQSSNELSHAIALVLAQTGWCNLLDLFTALQENRFSTTTVPQSVLTEDNVRAEIKRMLTHQIVRYDSRNGRYALDVLFGTLRILFPIMAQEVIRHAGPVGETALQLLYEHHDLPINVLTNLVYDANPQLGHAAVDKIIKALQTEEWVIQVSSTAGGKQQQQQNRDTSVKSDKGESAGNTTGASMLGGGSSKNAVAAAVSNTGLNPSFGINYAKFLSTYRSNLIVKYASENLNNQQRSIVGLLLQHRVKEKELPTASHADENPSPRLPNFGQELSIDKIAQRLAQTNQASVDQAHGLIRSLTNDGLRPLVQVIQSNNNNNNAGGNNSNNNSNTVNVNDLFGGLVGGNSNANASTSTSSSTASANVRFHYENAMTRIRRSLMCAEVRARFGLLGQRIVKILFEHHALEDKNIAEEGLISLQDLHQLLLAMQGQGILGLQELMKLPAGGVSLSVQIAANSGPDRSMKQSIFLWRLQERSLLSLVRRRVYKSICALRVRMRAEMNAVLADGNANNGNDISGPRVPENNAARIVSSTSNNTSNISRHRLGMIQEHMSKSLVALYEELALSTFCG